MTTTYTVYEYTTGRTLRGRPSARLVRASLRHAGHEGLVLGRWDDRDGWVLVDPSDETRWRRSGATVRTVWVAP